MNNEIYAAIVGPIIGGFLATISGVGLYFLQRHWEIKKRNTLFITAIKDDLSNAIPLYEKIKNFGETQQFIPFEFTSGLKKSRIIYERYMEHLLLIKPYSLRKRIFDYYLQSGSLIDKLESYQNRVDAIKNSYNSTLRRIREANPDFTEDQITKRTLDLNENENKEFMWLTHKTLEQLNNLDSTKMQAQLIFDKLSDKYE